GATGDKDPQFAEELFFALPFIICRQPIQSSRNQSLRPAAIEEAIFVARTAVSLEKRLRLFRLRFIQRQKISCTPTLQRPFPVNSVGDKILYGCQQKRTELAFLPIRTGVNFIFEQVSEKTLGEILRIVHSVPPTAHEIVKRCPIRLAKFRQRDARDVRFGLASPGREHHAPVSRRKQIAPTVSEL